MSTESQARPRRGVLRWVLGIIFGLLLLVALGALAWYLFRSNDVISDTFEGEIERVVVEVDGRVDLNAGGTVAVEAGREWLFTGPPDVEMTLEDGVLRIVSRCGPITLFCRVSVNAVVPGEAEIVVDTSAGSVTVDGTNAGVDLSSDAGGITVDVSGPAVLRTSAGAIAGTIRDGDVEASTSAGSIDLTLEGDFRDVSAVTSAGSVHLTLPDLVYDVDASTSAGEVTIDVRTDPDSELTVHARSSAGDVTIERG
jgi:hypothetical protein